MKKQWLLGLVTAGVLLVGVAGGTVLAQETSSDGASENALKSLPARVAAILGLDEQEVQDAFTQARREMQDDLLQQKLDRLVESGRITPEQAGDYLEWFRSRPQDMGPLGFGPRHHGFHRFGGWMRSYGPHEGAVSPSETTAPALYSGASF